MNIDKNIARNIKYYRESLGITQKQLAEKLYKTESTVQKWEVGKNRIYPEHLYELSQIFGIRMEELIMKNNVGILAFYKDTEEMYNYDMGCDEAVEYEGLDAAAEGLIEYCKDCIQNNIPKFDTEKNRWVDEWNTKNHYIVVLNVKTGEIYGLRDFGRYLPSASDYMFSSDFLNIEVNNKLLYIVEHTMSVEDLGEENIKSEDEWFKIIKDEIAEKSEIVRKLFKEEMAKYKEKTRAEKKVLFVTMYAGKGEYLAYDIESKNRYMLNRYDSDKDTLYIRDERSDYILGLPVSVKMSDDYILHFPSRELMEAMGLYCIPEDFEQMTVRENPHYEILKKYTCDDSEIDEVYSKIIQLLNIYPISERESRGYKILKVCYTNVTERLEKNEPIDEKMASAMRYGYEEAFQNLTEFFAM